MLPLPIPFILFSFAYVQVNWLSAYHSLTTMKKLNAHSHTHTYTHAHSWMLQDPPYNLLILSKNSVTIMIVNYIPYVAIKHGWTIIFTLHCVSMKLDLQWC